MKDLIFPYNVNPIWSQAVPGGIIGFILGCVIGIIYHSSMSNFLISGGVAGIAIFIVMSFCIIHVARKKVKLIKSILLNNIKKIIKSNSVKQSNRYYLEANEYSKLLVYYSHLNRYFKQLFIDKKDILNMRINIPDRERRINYLINDFQMQKDNIEAELYPY